MERNRTPDHPEGLTPLQEFLCTRLLYEELGIVRFGEFKLKVHDKYPDAPLSPIYIDLRGVQRSHFIKRYTINVYEELVQDLDFNFLAGIPMAATPITSSLADKLGKGMVTPRMETKTHGSGAKIDGLLPSDEGSTVLLVDDVITTAASKIEAARLLREAGVNVRDCVVLIDREQGGKEELAKKEIALHAAFTLKQMMDFGLRNGDINQEIYDRVFSGLAELNSFLQSH